MSGMKHRPEALTQHELVEVLNEMRRRVEAGDSLEGFVEYLLPWDGDDPDTFRVRARFRVGNADGSQGGMRIVGRLA